jgi:hypothetical protein
MLLALNEPDKLFAALQLVEHVITDRQWETFCTADLERKAVLDTAKLVEKACMKTMRQKFEKRPPATKVSRPQQPYYIGLGTRMVTFKSTSDGAKLFPETKLPSSQLRKIFTIAGWTTKKN